MSVLLILVAMISCRHDLRHRNRHDGQDLRLETMETNGWFCRRLIDSRPHDVAEQGGQPEQRTGLFSRFLAAAQLPWSFSGAGPATHALEASPEPGKADASANALRGKHPALGHLLHMPSHIDIRRARWQEAVEANRLAIEADAKYQKAVPEQAFYRLYMSHNYHMLTFAAMMQGESARALKTIRAMIAAVPKEWATVKENAAIVDGFMAMELEVLTRFGRWDDILKEPEPPEFFPIARAMWHYNRGVAFAAKGQVEDAREAEKTFREVAAKVPTEATFGNNKAAELIAIAEQVLEGEIFLRERKLKEAIVALERAVELEDKLRFSEPPDWFVPVRHALGAVLLRDGQAEAAEKVYREDLRRWPDNGWSLHGLAHTLEVLGRHEHAAHVKERFKEVWKQADVKIPSSCFCVEK